MARFKRTEGTKKMKLNELRDNDGARKERIRVGRGIAPAKARRAAGV